VYQKLNCPTTQLSILAHLTLCFCATEEGTSYKTEFLLRLKRSDSDLIDCEKCDFDRFIVVGIEVLLRFIMSSNNDDKDNGADSGSEVITIRIKDDVRNLEFLRRRLSLVATGILVRWTQRRGIASLLAQYQYMMGASMLYAYHWILC
jgi:hypothetical protein